MGFLTGLLITLIILVLFLRISVNIILEYKEDKPGVAVKVLGIKYTVLPAKPKKSKYKKLSSAAYKKKLEKMKENERKKLEKKAQKEEKKRRDKELKKQQKAKEQEKVTKEEKKQKRRDLVDTIRYFAKIGARLLKKFGKRLRIKAARMHIVVASSDAATTAIMYGAVTQAAAYLFVLLDKITTFKYSKDEFSISADFCSEKLRADILLIFKIRLWHVFALGLGFGIKFIKRLVKGKIKGKKDKENTKKEENILSDAVSEVKA